MGYYILPTILLVTMLILEIIIICAYHIKHPLKQKPYCHINNIKMASNNELKEIYIKNYACYYFDDIININDLHLNNLLLDEKAHETFCFI